MKNKTLHVIKTLELGGAETNLRNLAGAFDPQRGEHHLAYSFGGELEEAFRKIPSLKLFKFSGSKHRNSSPQSAAIILKLWLYLRRHRIRVVHTHNFNGHFWGMHAARLAGAKLIEHVHDFRYFDTAELERRHGYSNLNRYIGSFKGRSDRVVVLTGQNRRFLVEGGFYPEDRVRIIPNGIPLPSETASTKKDVAKELGVPEDSRLVLVASRLAPEKNIELVLKLAPEIARQVPGTVFLIAGSGPSEKALQEEAAAKGLGAHVRFIGFYADISRLMRSADVFLLPSYLELHSIAILEALSLGVPVVASSGVGCNSEVFTHGRDAFLHDPFSDEGWAQTLVRLLKDGDLRASIGRAGRELCRERFDIRKTARRFEELYEEVAR